MFRFYFPYSHNVPSQELAGCEQAKPTVNFTGFNPSGSAIPGALWMSVVDNVAHVTYFPPVSVRLQSRIPCGLLCVTRRMPVRCSEEQSNGNGPFTCLSHRNDTHVALYTNTFVLRRLSLIVGKAVVWVVYSV